MSKAIFCKNCGQVITFERTSKGKSMPVDAPSVFYHPDRNGKHTVLNADGEIEKGWILSDIADGASIGHRPHFITCKEYKKEAPKKQKPEHEQTSLY